MTGFTACVFLYPNRVSLNEAFEVLEPDDGKPSRPVLRGPGPSNGARLLDPSVFAASCVSFQLRPLPSTGITRFQRYCEPLRHPKRPGLALASCQLIPTAITAGASRVASGPLCLHAVATSPAGPMEPIRSKMLHQRRPSPDNSWVGSCII